MYPDKRTIASTQSVQPTAAGFNARFAEIVAQNPDAGLSPEEASRRFAEIVAANALSDYEIAAGSMHKEVRAQHEAQLLSNDGQPNYLELGGAAVGRQGVWSESMASERQQGPEAVDLTFVIDFAARAGARLDAERDAFVRAA